MKINYVHTTNIHNANAANAVLPYVLQLIKPTSVVDVGCGTGTWLKVASQLGVKRTFGIDGILADNLLEIDKQTFMQHDLSTPIRREEKFGLAICLEVAEHLPSSSADVLVESLCGLSDIILFSAAIPGQDGQFHINEQWPAYWQEKFKSRKYLTYDFLRERFWNDDSIEWWYRQNMMFFVTENNPIFINHKPVDKVIGKVHPELFDLKVNKLNFFESTIKERLWNPQIFPSLKLVIKAIVNVFK